MHTLTAQDLRIIRSANDLAVHLNELHPGGLVRFILERVSGGDNKEYTLPIPVTLYSGEKVTTSNFALIGLYKYGWSSAYSAFALLKPGDNISLQFYPNALTNATMVKANLYGDGLYLHVTRGKKHFSFLINTSVCPENSARMCQGQPYSETLQRWGKEAS